MVKMVKNISQILSETQESCCPSPLVPGGVVFACLRGFIESQTISGGMQGCGSELLTRCHSPALRYANHPQKKRS